MNEIYGFFLSFSFFFSLVYNTRKIMDPHKNVTNLNNCGQLLLIPLRTRGRMWERDKTKYIYICISVHSYCTLISVVIEPKVESWIGKYLKRKYTYYVSMEIVHFFRFFFWLSFHNFLHIYIFVHSLNHLTLA